MNENSKEWSYQKNNEPLNHNDFSMSSIKEESIHLIQSLPDSVTWDDIIYEMYVKKKIEKGLKDIEEGRVVPHEEVKKRFGL